MATYPKRNELVKKNSSKGPILPTELALSSHKNGPESIQCYIPMSDKYSILPKLYIALYMKHSWRTTSSKSVYSNPHFDIEQHEIIRPNGTHGTYWVVDRHGPFSIIIPLFSGNKTLLIDQYRYASDYYSWEFPMGQVKGKSPLTMAKQELSEETGYSAAVWNLIGRFFIGHGHTNQEAFVYTAKKLTAGTPTPEPGEDLKFNYISVDEVSAKIAAGDIKDGPTITAWALFKTRRKK